NNPGVPGDDIVVKPGGVVRSTAGNIDLRTGDNLAVHGALNAQGNVNLLGDYNNNDPTAGSLIDIDGAIQAAGVSIATGAGNDTINLRGSIQAPTISVDGGAGNDAFNVQKTMPGSTTTISAGLGGDTFNISSSAPLAGGTLAN